MKVQFLKLQPNTQNRETHFFLFFSPPSESISSFLLWVLSCWKIVHKNTCLYSMHTISTYFIESYFQCEYSRIKLKSHSQLRCGNLQRSCNLEIVMLKVLQLYDEILLVGSADSKCLNVLSPFGSCQFTLEQSDQHVVLQESG